MYSRFSHKLGVMAAPHHHSEKLPVPIDGSIFGICFGCSLICAVAVASPATRTTHFPGWRSHPFSLAAVRHKASRDRSVFAMLC